MPETPFLEEIIAPSHIIISDLTLMPCQFLNEENVLTSLESNNGYVIGPGVTISTTPTAKEGQEEEESEDFDDRDDDNEVIIIPDSPPVSAAENVRIEAQKSIVDLFIASSDDSPRYLNTEMVSTSSTASTIVSTPINSPHLN